MLNIPTGKKGEAIKTTIQLYELGMPIKEISIQRDCTFSNVYAILIKYGFIAPKFNRRTMSELEKKQIVSDYNSGMRTKDISFNMGFSRASIVNALNEVGVTYRDSDRNPPIIEQTLKIISLYKDGYSRPEIRNMLNIPKGRLDSICCNYRLIGQVKFYRTRNKINDNYFDNIDHQNKAYFLGLIFADGWVNYKDNNNGFGISLKKEDGYLVRRLKKELESTAKIGERVFNNNPTWQNSIYVTFTSQNIKKKLIDYGCTPKKSLTLIFPEISGEYFWHFLRGYFDGDGCISIHKDNPKNKTVTIVGSDHFIVRLREILADKYAINSCYGARKNYSTLSINKREHILKIREYFYSDAVIFMKRKRKKFFQ